MKKLLLFLFLIPNLVIAETNTSNNLQVGGISIFDNLNDHLTPKMIREGKKGLENYYKHLKTPLKFPTVAIVNHPTINKKYKRVEINYKTSNGKLIIHSISGGEFYGNINSCYKDMNSLVEYVSQKFPNLKKLGPDKTIHTADSSGESSVTQYSLRTDEYIVSAQCFDWSETKTRVNNWHDNLSLVITSYDFDDWLGDTTLRN